MSNTLSEENEAKLRALITQEGFGAVEELIVQHSVECAVLLLGEPEDYAVVGNARYGGVPDLPEYLDWPRDGYGKCLSFMMQINLADVPPIVGSPLPARGMLYCFHGDDAESVCGEGSRILYADVETRVLGRANKPDSYSMDEYARLKPYQLEIQTALNLPQWTCPEYREVMHVLTGTGDLEAGYEDFASKVKNPAQRIVAGQLLGQPAWIGYVPDDQIALSATVPQSEWFLLWRVNSSEEVEAIFWDAGYVQVYARREAAVQGSFGLTMTEVETS
jgi:hypothetical protein